MNIDIFFGMSLIFLNYGVHNLNTTVLSTKKSSFSCSVYQIFYVVSRYISVIQVNIVLMTYIAIEHARIEHAITDHFLKW